MACAESLKDHHVSNERETQEDKELKIRKKYSSLDTADFNLFVADHGKKDKARPPTKI